MITLTDHASTPDLDAKSVQSLFKLLAIDNPPDVSDFLENNPDDPTFYSFFDTVLLENKLPCAISIDWKWYPEDIFWQFNLSMSSDTIHDLGKDYDGVDYDPEQQLFKVTYQYKEATKHIAISLDEPGKLLAELMQYLPGKDVINIDFQEDSYSWLIVPKNFDVQGFCKITGLLQEGEPIPEPPSRVPENFAEGYKQPEKIFFTPRIIFVEQNGTGYHMPNQFWAGRALPGQTIREGIASELQQEMHYSGRFDYSYDNYIGVQKDRKGRDIKKYRLTIYLYDHTFESRMAGGADVQLKKITGEKFSYPENA